MLPDRQSHPSRAERAFSLIEVIIAMTILSIVLSGAAVAVVSSDSAEIRTEAVADSHAMAEKAIERLRTDLSAQSGCDRNGWITTARNVKQSGSTAEANFLPCLVTYNDMEDSKGRQYRISLLVEAKDRADDGFGVSDSDNDLRDAYDVEATVALNANSTAGRESMPTISAAGTVDWEGGSADDAQIRIVACAIDRPDRALVAGGCENVANAVSRVPLTVTVGVSKVNEETGAATPFGSITSGTAPVLFAPGAYRFIAPQTVGTFTLLKLDPADLRVYGSQNYTIHATYVRNALTTRVCTQVTNWDNRPINDGYEMLQTNMHWRRTNQSGYRSIQLNLNGDGNPRRGDQSGGRNRTWNCAHVLKDPVGGSQGVLEDLFRGIYDIEVDQYRYEQNPRYYNKTYPSPTPIGDYHLSVRAASMNCTLAAYNAPMGGTLLQNRPRDPVNERLNTTANTMGSFYARMPINATSGTQTLCLRFYAKEFERVRCYDPDTDGSYNRENPTGGPLLNNCFYVGTICTLPLPAGTQDDDNNCWNGADVCVTCAGGALQGTVGAVQGTLQTGGVSGGPNDGTVACNTTGKYSWLGSHHNGWGMSPLIGKAQRDSYDWIGGSDYYYSNYSGRTSARAGHSYGVHPDRFTYNLPDNPPYMCEMSYFTAGSALFQGNGGPYRYYECLEVQVPGRPYKVRGRLLDVSGSSNTFFGTVGTALALAPDSSKMQNYWNPFGGGDGYPDVTGGGNWPDYRVSRVTGDPNCGAPTIHIDPIIEEIWNTVIDEGRTRSIGAPNLTNLSTDRVGV